MAHVKTAISIDEFLFKEASELAAEMNKTRSELFAIAISDLIKKQKDRKLLEKINAAYNDKPDTSEIELLQAMKAKHRRILDEERW